MTVTCLCCGKKFDYKLGVTGFNVGLKYACMDCCETIGIPSGFRGMIKAGNYTPRQFLKKHDSVTGFDRKAHKKKEKEQQRQFALGELEKKHICQRCGHVWYSDHNDELKQFVKATTLISGNDDLSTNMAVAGSVEPDQCPKCGSRNTTVEFVSMESETLPEIEYVSESPAPAPVTQNVTDAADEIRKFKALMDDGIISAEEFEAKKKQLLGL